MNEILQIDNETEIVTSESNTSVCITVEVYMYIGLIFQFEKKELFIQGIYFVLSVSTLWKMVLTLCHLVHN